MVSVFLDTSAIFALLDSNDAGHQNALDAWDTLDNSGSELVTTNYALVEAVALVQNRLGMDAPSDLLTRIASLPTVVWVDEALHNQGSAMLITARQRRLSLLDCVSFAAMRQLGIDTAFTFDSHFAEQGFKVIP